MFSLEDELNGPMEDLDLSAASGGRQRLEELTTTLEPQPQQQQQQQLNNDPLFPEEHTHHYDPLAFVEDNEEEGIPPPPLFGPPPVPSSIVNNKEDGADVKKKLATGTTTTPSSSSLLASLAGTNENDEDDLFAIGDIEEEEEEEEEINNNPISTSPTSSFLDPLNAILMEERKQQQQQQQEQKYSSSAYKMDMSIPPTPVSTPISSPRPTLRSNPHAGLNIPNSSTILPTIPQQQLQHQQPVPPSQQPTSTLEILPPLFSSVLVSNPTFVKDSLFGFNLIPQGSYWLYNVTSTLYPDTANNNNNNSNAQQQQQKVVVLRRFRHFVALEDRLRKACPGAILPPRPEKRQMDSQPQNFAQNRCQELTKYLTALIQHPIAGRCRQELGFFLTFNNDDLGTAWLEVSSNALTRLTAGVLPKTWDFLGGAVSASHIPNSSVNTIATPPTTALSTSSMFSDGATESMWVGGGNTPTKNNGNDLSSFTSIRTNTSAMVSSAPTEENAQLFALQNFEHMRLATVSQAIPKLEGGLTLLIQQKEHLASTAMELSKLSRDLLKLDQPLTSSIDVVSKAMLKSSRRKTKWLNQELRGALVPFSEEFQLVRMERAAFQDRRTALLKRHALRQQADAKAQLLVAYHQQQQQSADAYAPTIVYEGGKILQLDQLELEAAQSDEAAVEAMRYAEHIGHVLQSEVARRKEIRHNEWMSSLKDIVYSMHAAHKDQVTIWENAKKQMMNTTTPSV